MENLKTIKKLVAEKRNLLRQKYGIKKIAVFGSYARGDAKPQSDVDVLVEYLTPPNIFEFLKLEQFLTRLFGKEVDLVTPKALKPLIKQRILREAVYL